MNSVPLLFLGLLATLATSFWGLVAMPYLKLGQQEFRTLDNGQVYPQARSGAVQAGAEVYRANGCVECHSMQVRANGPDKVRGWGTRTSVHQDYLLDQPVLLGSQRIGPDLTTAGARAGDATYQLQHLYNPRLKVPGSSMPRYVYLFEKRKIAEGGKLSPDALPADTEPGFEIVPKPEARALAAFLVSLQAQPALFEAPIPAAPTNAPAAAAPAAAPVPAPQ